MSALGRYWRGQFDIDFLGRQRVGLSVSAVLVLVTVGSLAVQGLDLGVEFRGGNVWQAPAGDVSVGQVRDALRPVGQGGARIQLLGGDTVQVQTPALPDDTAARVTAALSDVTGAAAGEISISEVGPSWGEDITAKAVRALVVFFALIALYISLRFEWRMAVAALVAVVHDVLISVGVYSVFGFQVTPATVIAFLTILGYSLYDTIVVFDKVQENVRGRRAAYAAAVNRSLNEVLTRSLNTTLTSLLPVLSILVMGSVVFGAATLQEFGIALLVGLLVGAYSSIFVAAPILARLHQGEAAPARAPAERSLLVPSGRPAPASSGDGVSGGEAAPAGGAVGPAARPPIQPRGRKKGRRR